MRLLNLSTLLPNPPAEGCEPYQKKALFHKKVGELQPELYCTTQEKRINSHQTKKEKRQKSDSDSESEATSLRPGNRDHPHSSSACRAETARSANMRLGYIGADEEEAEQGPKEAPGRRQPGSSFGDLTCDGLRFEPEAFTMAKGQQPQTLDQGELLAVLEGRMYLGCVEDPLNIRENSRNSHWPTVYITKVCPRKSFNATPFAQTSGHLTFAAQPTTCFASTPLARGWCFAHLKESPT